LKKREMRYKWKKYNWWIYCVIIAIAVFIILYFVYPATDKDNARYILSAISQGLAAILALVFTITLVVSQMTRRYTAMDKIIFRPETIILMVIFGIGVIIPLLVLKIGFWGCGVILSIAIASFCVFSLIPFLKGVKDVLKYDIGIGNLNEEIMEAIELGYEPKAKNKIMELNKIGRDAVKGFREDAVSSIIHFLSKIGKKSAEKGFEDATFFVWVGLKDVGIEGTERGFEDVIVQFAAKGLSGLRVNAAKNQWENIAILATDSLRDIGVKAAEKGLSMTTNTSIEGLKYDVSLRNGMEFLEETVRGLLCLGAAAQQYVPKKVDYVNRRLREIDTETHLVDAIIEVEGEASISKYPYLKNSFGVFTKQYNEG
jgi:hypothetical protein